jgi:hypothetical protein
LADRRNGGSHPLYKAAAEAEIDEAFGTYEAVRQGLGSKLNNAWSSTSAFGPTPDFAHAELIVRDEPTCDMAAIDKVQRIASPSDCAAAALCFRGELVLPII